jgi:hypothetical protein
VSESGSYLYGITQRVPAGCIDSVRGVGGGELRVVSHSGLDAIVSSVDLDEFGEDGLRRNLENLEWLEEVARAHDHVLKQVAAVATIAPARLATIYLADDGVRERLEQWHDDLVQALGRVEGRSEWSVKVYALPAAENESEAADATAVSSGTAYLERRRAQLAKAGQTAEEAALIADQIHRTLADSSCASRRLPPQDQRLSGHSGTMTLNGAYLIDMPRTDDFCALVDQLAKEHSTMQVDLRGPWPPYSFTTLEMP